MAFLGQTFVAAELPQATTTYEPLPAGWYSAIITQSELRTNAAGDGQYIKVRYDITGPTHQGRVVFGNLNIRNNSLKAEEIGRQQLGQIMKACNLPKIDDTDDLIGGSLQIKLNIRPPRTDEKTGRTYEASNEVQGFKSLEGSPAAPAVMPATVAPITSSARKAAPPWQKK